MFDIGLNPMFFMLHGRKFFMLLECLRICFAFNLFRLQTRTRYGVYECYSHKIHHIYTYHCYARVERVQKKRAAE